jgi:hypothetical protein
VVNEAEMHWVLMTIRLLALVFFGLVLPQALGLVGYRWTRHKGTLLKLATLLIAPVVFFISAYLFWGQSAQAIRDSGNYVCGAFGAARVFSTMFGTLFHLIMGVILFLVVSFIWKRKASKPQTEQ